jgi:cytoskeletal protein CcmA (bactofilin family)
MGEFQQNQTRQPTATPAGEEQITVIGAGTHIKGEMTFDRTARILGTFEGKISSNGEVQVGRQAQCLASIEAETIKVDGTVEGDLRARETAHLSATASMRGDVVAARLHVAEGASFEGHVRVGPDALGEGRADGRADTRIEARPEPQLQQPEPQPGAAAVAEVRTRPVDVARNKLAEAQARLARMNAEEQQHAAASETLHMGEEAAA